LAIFGCLVGERYFMEGLNLWLLSSDQYQDIAPTDKKKEKEKGPNENWPNLVLWWGIIEINQDDIDLVDSVPTIIEKIKVKWELANIKDVKYNNESIIKCEWDTPYINKKAMKDVIWFWLLFHKKTWKTLNIASSYRTQAHQERLVAENATEREYRDGNGDIQNGKVPTAPVGYSWHNQWLSIDINSNLLSDLNHTDLKSLKWLQELAGIFNFNSISSEAWHFDHQSFSDQLVWEDVGNVEKGKRFAESTKMDESYQANRANRA
jgi:hypothetical protein